MTDGDLSLTFGTSPDTPRPSGEPTTVDGIDVVHLLERAEEQLKEQVMGLLADVESLIREKTDLQRNLTSVEEESCRLRVDLDNMTRDKEMMSNQVTELLQALAQRSKELMEARCEVVHQKELVAAGQKEGESWAKSACLLDAKVRELSAELTRLREESESHGVA